MAEHEKSTQIPVKDIETKTEMSSHRLEETTHRPTAGIAEPEKGRRSLPAAGEKRRVGIAFQGGVFPAGAMHAGVVKYLVEAGAFSDPAYDIDAFSGSSAGALVASICWGHKMQGAMKQAPKVLEEQWLQFAWNLVPTAAVARNLMLLDELGRINPLYDLFAEEIRVPWTRKLMKWWVEEYVRPDELVAVRNGLAPEQVPLLALGAANIRTGEPTVFREWDFCLETVLASGSLEEVNGATTISAGPLAGTYLDGAWGTNPPISFLLEDRPIEDKIDELWVIEFWPKVRADLPKTHLERRDRHDELWQNSLVEHEIGEIERVNRWLEDGTIATGGRFKPIRVKRMPMTLDLPKGATFINTRAFIREMMAYGYASAQLLYEAKKRQGAVRPPAQAAA